MQGSFQIAMNRCTKTKNQETVTKRESLVPLIWDDAQGGWKFKSSQTGKSLKQCSWDVTPVTQETINDVFGVWQKEKFTSHDDHWR